MSKKNPHIIKKADEASFNCTINSPELVAFLSSVIPPMWKLLRQMVQVIADTLKKYPNRRVLHLARHGSPRTRKKNVKRIVRFYRRRNR